MLNITVAEIMNRNKVKVLDGIAGSGKSTVVNELFSKAGVKYARFTSTNRLKREAENRFGGDVFTVAGGLFTNTARKFYEDFKKPECKNIVIDEILQTSPRVFEWIEANKNDYNIIVCTDGKQMLTPGAGEDFLKAFDALKSESYVYTTTETHRAVTPETVEQYLKLYDNVSADKIAPKSYLYNNFDCIKYNEIPDYVGTWGYITHTRNLEERLYLDYDIKNLDANFIPKGFIAGKKSEGAKGSYPVLSQKTAEDMRSKSYMQIDNVGTPTRWQGGQVEKGERLFYFIEPTSDIKPRELYTVITRARDIADITIVLCEKKKEPVFVDFCGLPVYEERLIVADKAPERASEWLEIAEKAKKANEKNKGKRNILYKTEEVIVDGKKVHKQKFVMEKAPAMSIKAQIAKDDSFYIPQTPEIYKRLEACGVDGVKFCMLDTNPEMKKEAYKYGLDLHSAFPSVLAYEKMPAPGDYSEEYDESRMNFFLYHGTFLTDGALITEELAKYITRTGRGNVEFLFSLPAQNGTAFGRHILKIAGKSEKWKAKTKDLRWGILERQYLEKGKTDTGEACYFIRKENIYAVIMAAVFSALRYIECLMCDVSGERVEIRTDEVLYNSPACGERMICVLSENFPRYRWRIYDKKPETALNDPAYLKFCEEKMLDEKEKINFDFFVFMTDHKFIVKEGGGIA